MMALRVSLGLRCESMKSIFSVRPATPPLALTNFTPACAPSTIGLNAFGASELSTSAMTATLMVFPVTPTSLASAAARGTPAPAGTTSAATNATPATSTNTERRVFGTVPPWIPISGPKGINHPCLRQGAGRDRRRHHADQVLDERLVVEDVTRRPAGAVLG